MDDKIVKAIDKLFAEARQGNKESFEIIGEIFSKVTHEMIVSQSCTEQMRRNYSRFKRYNMK